MWRIGKIAQSLGFQDGLMIGHVFHLPTYDNRWNIFPSWTVQVSPGTVVDPLQDGKLELCISFLWGRRYFLHWGNAYSRQLPGTQRNRPWSPLVKDIAFSTDVGNCHSEWSFTNRFHTAGYFVIYCHLHKVIELKGSSNRTTTVQRGRNANSSKSSKIRQF